MQAYQVKWFKAPAALNVDTYKVVRIKEDEQLEQNKLAFTEHVIGTTDGDVISFEDATTYEDRTAYHYLVVGYNGDKVAITSEWSRVWRRHNWGLGGDVIIKGNEVFGYMGDFDGVDNFVNDNLDIATFNYKRDIVSKFVVNGNIVYVPYVGFVGSAGFISNAVSVSAINSINSYIANEGLGEIELDNISFKHNALLPENIINTLLPVFSTNNDMFVVNKPFGYDVYVKAYNTNVIYANGGSGSMYYRFDFGGRRPSVTITPATTSTTTGPVIGFRTMGAWIETVPEEVVEP